MKRGNLIAPIFLLLLCVSLSNAYADVVPARIILGTREARVVPMPVFDGDRVLAPLSILKQLNASYVTTSDDSKLTVMAPGGASGDVQTVDVNGAKMIPMDVIMRIVGADGSWNGQTHTYTATAKLQSVEYDNGLLKINCSFPVHCGVKVWANKLIVDVHGAKAASDASEVYIGTPAVDRARIGQYSDTSARVVLDLKKKVGWKVVSESPSSQIQVSVSGDSLRSAAAAVPTPAPKKTAAVVSEASSSFAIERVRIEPVDANSFNVMLITSSKGNFSFACETYPPQITLILPGGSFSDSMGKIEGTHDLLKEVKTSHTSKDVRIDLLTERIMTLTARVSDNAIVVNVKTPDHSGGDLAGKLVVIDPGHGGSQTGARSGSLYEKNVTLQIAKVVADVLESEGIRTILTRNDDTAMGLAERAEVAINDKADFFISIHCNSNGSTNSATGIETYYHMQESSPRALAFAIHEGVCSVTGMCDRRARSDRSLYASGLGVLRRLEGSGIPGVLVECGYINNGSDRAKLVDANYQKKLAAGILAGLRAYVEGTAVR